MRATTMLMSLAVRSHNVPATASDTSQINPSFESRRSTSASQRKRYALIFWERRKFDNIRKLRESRYGCFT